jgi:hypothetical protein
LYARTPQAKRRKAAGGRVAGAIVEAVAITRGVRRSILVCWIGECRRCGRQAEDVVEKDRLRVPDCGAPQCRMSDDRRERVSGS